MKNIKLSILDQSTISKGNTAFNAIQQTVQLVQKAEAWGYHRFWMSEHHNLASIAGSAPEVLIAHLAAFTKTIRLGAGGIMLPNHSSLKVARKLPAAGNPCTRADRSGDWPRTGRRQGNGIIAKSG